MTPTFDRLLDLAQTEVQTAIDALPDELRPAAESVPVILEPTPNAGYVTDGIAPDTLGLFLGESMADPPSSHPQPTQIILFLELFHAAQPELLQVLHRHYFQIAIMILN